jgi:hypothetical protein
MAPVISDGMALAWHPGFDETKAMTIIFQPRVNNARMEP